jgi:hypothetical protein
VAAARPDSMLVIVTVPIPMGIAGMVLVELLGAIGTIEFMALAGYSAKRDRRHHQGKKFHRAVS